MNNLSKKIIDEEGKEETLLASSNDNYNLKLDGKYSLVNRKSQKESAFARKFKNSIFGADIGFKSRGFSSVAILSVVIALAALIAMYFMWRF